MRSLPLPIISVDNIKRPLWVGRQAQSKDGSRSGPPEYLFCKLTKPVSLMVRRKSLRSSIMDRKGCSWIVGSERVLSFDGRGVRK